MAPSAPVSTPQGPMGMPVNPMMMGQGMGAAGAMGAMNATGAQTAPTAASAGGAANIGSPTATSSAGSAPSTPAQSVPAGSTPSNPVSTVPSADIRPSDPAAPIHSTTRMAPVAPNVAPTPLITAAATTIPALSGTPVPVAGGIIRAATLRHALVENHSIIDGAIGVFNDKGYITYVLATRDAYCLIPEGVTLPDGILPLNEAPDSDKLDTELFGAPAEEKLEAYAEETDSIGDLMTIVTMFGKDGLTGELVREITSSEATAMMTDSRWVKDRMVDANDMRTRATGILSQYRRIPSIGDSLYLLRASDIRDDRAEYLDSLRAYLRAELKKALADFDYATIAYVLDQLDSVPAE